MSLSSGCRGWCRLRTANVPLLATALLFSAGPAVGQSLPTLDFTGRPGESRPELLERRDPGPPPTLSPPSPSEPARDNASRLPGSLFVRTIVVTGSTVFTPEEIARVTAHYGNRNLTMEGIESLRRDLTLLYVNKGYINSGAVVPDQAVTDGRLTIRIVEGKLSHIAIGGNRWFGESYLRDRIALGAGAPVNIVPLQDRLQRLQQDRRIERIQAELRPGARAGESELAVRVVEKPPRSVSAAFNNYQSPSIGAERGLVTLAHQNLTGHGDIFSFTYGYSEGLNPLIDTGYTVPVSAWDTTFSFRYRKNDAKVVDGVFGPLGIVNKTESFEAGLRQPVYRTLHQEVALSLSVEREESRSFLSGEPFSFSPGTENGKSIVVPLRFGQEWTYRSRRQVFAARSRMTYGLDAGGATVNHGRNVPDGRFFAWLGQLQWARILDFRDTQVIARADIQRSRDPLLPVEQMAVGGRYSVRGYRESLLVKDDVFIASLETRIPLIRDARWADPFQFATFLDYGRGTNVDLPDNGPTELSSVGAGIRWGASTFKGPFDLRSEAEIYWGYRLRNLPHVHDDPQDEGIHFQISVSAFF